MVICAVKKKKRKIWGQKNFEKNTLPSTAIKNSKNFFFLHENMVILTWKKALTLVKFFEEKFSKKMFFLCCHDKNLQNFVFLFFKTCTKLSNQGNAHFYGDHGLGWIFNEITNSEKKLKNEKQFG